jgi:hypothetical protein
MPRRRINNPSADTLRKRNQRRKNQIARWMHVLERRLRCSQFYTAPQSPNVVEQIFYSALTSFQCAFHRIIGFFSTGTHSSLSLHLLFDGAIFVTIIVDWNGTVVVFRADKHGLNGHSDWNVTGVFYVPRATKFRRDKIYNTAPPRELLYEFTKRTSSQNVKEIIGTMAEQTVKVLETTSSTRKSTKTINIGNRILTKQLISRFFSGERITVKIPYKRIVELLKAFHDYMNEDFIKERS